MQVPAWAADLVAAASEVLGPLRVDGWRPPSTDHVGRLLGLRTEDGAELVLKAYERTAAGLAAREASALGGLEQVADLPVPGLIHHGERGPGVSHPYVVITRLPGARWADVRPALDQRAAHALDRAVGRFLRDLHVVGGDRFGDVRPGGRTWPDTWRDVEIRCDELVGAYVEHGGPVDLGRRLHDFVHERRWEVESCEAPVLCHGDLSGAHLLVAADGLTITGLVDLSRARWDDPLADLARTRLHLRRHDEVGADALVKAYGLRSDEEQERLAVHELLAAAADRKVAAATRLPGWRERVSALDAFLRARTA